MGRLMEVLILGMHRSGTSLVSAIVNKLGIFGGDEETLERSAEWNPKGYWEYRQFTQANNRILAVLGANWDRVAGLDDTLFSAHEAKIAGICAELETSFRRFGERPDWAIKDPRLCLVLPAWRGFLHNPLAVLVVRDPIEVAISLQKRNQMPLVAGIALWEFYMKSALRHSRQMPRVLVDYNALLRDPDREISALRDALARSGATLTGVTEDVRGFVDASLYRSRNLDIQAKSLLNLKQAEFYDALRQGRPDAAELAVSAGGLEVLGLHEAANPELPAWKKKWRHFSKRPGRSGK
jgi:Uncharacterized protein conserved in bacteria